MQTTEITVTVYGDPMDALRTLAAGGVRIRAARFHGAAVDVDALQASLEAAAASEPAANPLATVNFASDAAAELAASAGLSVADFEGKPPSSTHGFTKADVQSVVDARTTA